MPDTEQVVLDIEERQAVQKAERANRALETIEKTAERGMSAATRNAETQSEMVVRVVDRSKNSIERLVQQAEKKAATAGMSSVQKIAYERDLNLKRVAGDPVAVDKVRTAYEKLIKAETDHNALAQEIGAAIRNPMDAASGAAERLATQLGPVGIVGIAAGAGLATVAVSAFELVKGAGAAAEEAVNLADRLGTTVGEAERLRAMTKIVGGDVGSLETAMRKLSQSLVDGGEEGKRGAEALEKYGIRARTAKGELKGTYEILSDIANKLAGRDTREMVAALNDILGRGSIALLPFIKNFSELEEMVRKAGVGVNEGLTRELAKADDQIDLIEISWSKLRKELSGAILGVIKLGVDDGKGGVTPMSEFTGAGGAPGMGSFARAAARERAQREYEAYLKANPPSESRSARREQQNAVAAGDRLVEQYEKRRTEEGLKAQLEQATKLRKEAEAKIIKGVEERYQRENILAAENARKKEESLKRELEMSTAIPKKRGELDKAAHEMLLTAQAQEHKGLSAILGEHLKSVDAMRTMVDAKGNIVRLHLSEKALLDANLALQIRMTAEYKKQAAEIVKGLEEEYTRRRDYAAKQMQDQQAFERDTLEMQRQTAATQLDRGPELERTRDARLRDLEAVNARTIQEQIAVERQRAEIEAEYYREASRLHREEIERRKADELEYLEWQKIIHPEMAQKIEERVAAIKARANVDIARDEADRDGKIAAARQTAANREVEIVRDAYQRTFDSLKDGFEGLFDAALAGGKGFADSLKRIFTSVFLAPVKQQMAAWVARMFTPMLGPTQTYGYSGGGAMAGAGGLLSMFVGGGMPAYAGMLGPGGTSGFAGPLGGLTQQGSIWPGIVGTSGSKAGMFGNFAGGWKSMLSGLGNIGQPAPGSMEAMIQQGFGGARGVGGMTGGAMLAGGGVLAFDGLRRGGVTGMFETAAGGALIGAKFGGPIGALIGGAIGLGAGIVRLFIKGASDKLKSKIKAAYGVDIQDKGVLNQILDMAKQQFGGNLDMAIRAPQVRDLIELYAMSTGQNMPMANKARPMFLQDVGGRLYQGASYENGQSFGYQSNLPLLGNVDRLVAPGNASIGPVTVVVQLDGQATTQVLRGEIVNAPRAVATANQSGQKASVGRREGAINMFNPSLVTG